MSGTGINKSSTTAAAAAKLRLDLLPFGKAELSLCWPPPNVASIICQATKGFTHSSQHIGAMEPEDKLSTVTAHDGRCPFRP